MNYPRRHNRANTAVTHEKSKYDMTSLYRQPMVVGSSPIPSSRTNRFVKPFGEHGGFSFFRDGLSECAISAPFQKSALIPSL